MNDNSLQRENERLKEIIKDKDRVIDSIKNENDAIKSSLIWKLSGPIREIGPAIKSITEKKTKNNQKIDGNISFSVVMPVYNVNIKWLKIAMNSVLEQNYSKVELILVDDCSTDAKLIGFLKKINHKQIKVLFNEKNEGISETTNKGVNAASGEYICLMDNDDELAEDTFRILDEYISQNGGDVIYSDQDIIDESGNCSNVLCKPDWSPDLLTSQMYIGHLLVVKKSLYVEIGGERKIYDGSQDYDLMLRLSRATRNIKHISHVLYHWRALESSTAVNPNSKPYSQTAGLRCIQDYFDNSNEKEAIVYESDNLFCYDVRYPNHNKKASIIIPTKDHKSDLETIIISIKEKTTYKNYEIIILNNNTTDSDTLDYFTQLEKDPIISVVDASFEFNWSKLNNYGTKYANGDVYVFLNNDTEIISEDWLERLVENAIRDEVGVVGALLLFPDGKIQHAGVVVGMGGWADHVYANAEPIHIGTPYISPMVTRNVTAVTGACMAISKDKFDKLGGFDEEFIVCGSDIELCIRAIENGYRNIYSPYIKLYHYESKTRSANDIPQIDFEKSYIAYAKYREDGDPYYNKQLDNNSKIPKWLGNTSLESNATVNVTNYEIPEIRQASFRKEVVEKKRLNLVIPSINAEHVFGGIATALSFFNEVCKRYDFDRRIILLDASPDKEAIEKYSEEYKILNCDADRVSDADIVDYVDRQSKSISISENDYFIFTIWYSFYIFAAAYRKFVKQDGFLPNKMIYLIQDYEPGFYKWSSRYMLAESTYMSEFDTIAIFNSNELKNYMIDRYHFYKSYVFDPILNEGLKKELNSLADEVKKKKIILVYGRPTTERNAFELNVAILKRWALLQEDADEWKILSAGEKHDDIEIGGNKIISVGKMTISEYATTLKESYAGLSLMVSPHPSYPPLEMAVFGVKVLTNEYANKNMNYFSENIISGNLGDLDSMAEQLHTITQNYTEYGKLDKSNESYINGKEMFPFISDLLNDL
ncbi:glycosyltransferase family 2 protein [Butyrivibrio sp. JL13D10]|uniref:glycosyltransferase family 2 protein n=1 Tax=Butyrivibrio sp. JL13D10 TaxID=3236815 RepID=UPI0038B55282